MAETNKPDYDAKYLKKNYFSYREWLYARYVASLISYCELKSGSSVLDVGCGQGFFSYLFRKNGMCVHGVDISESGIRLAQDAYGDLGIVFEAADIVKASLPGEFDCIFVRSCSLYNTPDFARSDAVTRRLLMHLKPNGTLIFVYNSTFSSRPSHSWRYHSLKDVEQHFKTYSCRRILFSSRIETCVFGKHAFSSFWTRLNMVISRLLGTGGDLVCILTRVKDEGAPAEPPT